jgi:hypothetical protein
MVVFVKYWDTITLEYYKYVSVMRYSGDSSIRVENGILRSKITTTEMAACQTAQSSSAK